MEKAKNKRVERLIFQCLITIKNPTREEAMRTANHERFRRKLYMVGDMCRVELTRISDCLSVFTVFIVADTQFSASSFYRIDSQRVYQWPCFIHKTIIRL